MFKVLGTKSADVLTWGEYKALAQRFKEPKHCVIFIGYPGEMGHWVGAFTDTSTRNKVIFYEDSFGLKPPSKIRNRIIKSSNDSVQASTDSNCGYHALAFVLSHNKVNTMFLEITKVQRLKLMFKNLYFE